METGTALNSKPRMTAAYNISAASHMSGYDIPFWQYYAFGYFRRLLVFGHISPLFLLGHRMLRRGLEFECL
jgi:hypothetical protein